MAARPKTSLACAPLFTSCPWHWPNACVWQTFPWSHVALLPRPHSGILVDWGIGYLTNQSSVHFPAHAPAPSFPGLWLLLLFDSQRQRANYTHAHTHKFNLWQLFPLRNHTHIGRVGSRRRCSLLPPTPGSALSAPVMEAKPSGQFSTKHLHLLVSSLPFQTFKGEMSSQLPPSSSFSLSMTLLLSCHSDSEP